MLESIFDRSGWHLGSNLEGFGAQVQGQVDKKIYHMASCLQVGRNSQNTKNPQVFQWFWGPRPSNFEAKLTRKHPQSDQKSSKNLVNILSNFHWILEPTWVAFGRVMAAKLDLESTRDRSKIDLQANHVRCQQKYMKYWVPRHAGPGGFL